MQAKRSVRCALLAAWVGLMIAEPVQAIIYTWTDAQGVRHYSDVSRPPGAHRARLAHPPVASASTNGAPTHESDQTQPGDARALDVVSPQQGQVFTNAQGKVPVSVIVGSNGDKGGLGEGESLRYRLDGGPIGQAPIQDTRLTLSRVSAGPHTLSVTLLYRGHAVQHSAAVSFRVNRRAGSTSSSPNMTATRPPS